MSAIAFSSSLFPVPISVVLQERHNSRLRITDNPIEGGANITDHAYSEPKRVTIEVLGEEAAATFTALTLFQSTRIPFYLVTGLSVYPNMLIENIDAERDARFSQVLHAWIDLREVQIVSTAAAAVDGGSIGSTSTGAPGGANSTSAAAPTPELSGDAVTADRAAGTAQSGDGATSTNESFLSTMF